MLRKAVVVPERSIVPLARTAATASTALRVVVAVVSVAPPTDNLFLRFIRCRSSTHFASQDLCLAIEV